MSLISSTLIDDSPLSSSTEVLQCSADGQIAMVTRGAIYLMTPDFNAPRAKNEAAVQSTFGWAKTAIHESGKSRAWSEDRVQWRIISLGAIETIWQAVAWSPSGLNRLGGCLLATLTNNMQVAIWAPTKNPLTGEWVKLLDVTESQMSSHDEESAISTEEILKYQTCSIAWSSSWRENANISSDKNDGSDSFLALGSRSGNVNVFCWDLPVHSTRFCLSYNVDDAWVARLAWSKWRPLCTAESAQSVQGYLACGLSNGSVWILTVNQTLGSQEPCSISNSNLVMEADWRSITALTFAEVESRLQPLLVVAKPGFITLCNLLSPLEDAMVEDPSIHTVLLSSPRASLASSSVSACTGLHYIPADDALVINLAEGSTIVLVDVSQKGYNREQGESPEQISTISLSKRMKQLTESAEGRAFDRAEYARIHALQFMGTGGYVVWMQEVLQPYDLSFRIQAHFRTRLCIAKLWESHKDPNDRIVASLRTVLSGPSLIAMYSPPVLLREIMFELQNNSVTISAAPHLLAFLAPERDPLDAGNVGGEGSGLLATALPTDDDIFTHQVRLKISLTLFLMNRSGMSGDVTSRFQSLYRILVETAVALHLQTMIRKIIALPDDSSLDRPSILRFMHGAQFCPIPDSVSPRFSQMKTQGQEYIRRNELNVVCVTNATEAIWPMLGLSRTADLGEKCPACGQVVLFQNLAQARCQTGHVWERCATSLQLISGIGSLTCSGCGRKSLDPSPQNLADPGTHCVLCGHRYFRAL